MGNCMVGTTKILLQGDHQKQEPSLKALVIKETASRVANNDGKKKIARLKLGEDDTSDDDKESVLRIRVVVTQSELHQLLKYTKGCHNFSSNKEQLVSALKLRGRRIPEVIRSGDGGSINGSWRPALESIPENHS